MNLFQFSKCCDKKITSPVSSKLPKLMSIHIKIQHIQSPTHRFLCKSTTAWDGLMEIITHPVNWLSCSTIDSTLSSSLFTVVLGEDRSVSAVGSSGLPSPKSFLCMSMDFCFVHIDMVLLGMYFGGWRGAVPVTMNSEGPCSRWLMKGAG